MKPLYLVANWKSNKTPAEAIEWLQNAKCQMPNAKLSNNVKIILCAPFTVLSILKEKIEQVKFPIHMGAQNISPFSSGAYTGEVSAGMLKGLAEYVIIGHSERRKYFGETDEMLLMKVKEAKKENLSVIYCVENSTMSVPVQADVIAYEPLAAIGSGKPEHTSEAEQTCKQLKEKHPNVPVLYGGSVTAETIGEFVRQPSIDGALVGGASLDPEQFVSIIKAASSYA